MENLMNFIPEVYCYSCNICSGNIPEEIRKC